MSDTTPAAVTVRSGPIGVLELSRAGFVVAVTNLTPPVAEVVARWRRTLIYGSCLVVYSVVLARLGVPFYAAPVIAWATLILAAAGATVGVNLAHRRHIGMWRAWRGVDGAVCAIEWNPKRRRYEAHSWAAFRRHRRLGGPVADAAIGDGPRPLWLEPALPGLRERYRRRYGFLDDSESRWMYLP